MKKVLLLLFSCMSFLNVSAQTANAILFTENGEKFTVILNGMRQNDKPETNVRITGLKAEFYKLKVIFDSRNIGEKNFNLSVELGNESSYCIKKNSKGEYVLRMISSNPVEQTSAVPSHSTVNYNENPAGAAVEQTTTQTTTTTTSSGDPDNVNVNFNINANENGGGVNFNVSGSDSQTSSTTTTVTHSHTTTTSEPPSNIPPKISYLPGYKGPVGCDNPINNDQFNALSQSVKSKSFEETKMTIAKQALNNQCLLVSQVKSLLGLFSFEETKLDFAKFAYHHTYDLGNYFQVNDAFIFETSSDELNQYIQAH